MQAWSTLWRSATIALVIGAAVLLTACNGGGGDGSAKFLQCDASLASQFKPDSNTTVLLVRLFRKGEALALSGTPSNPPPPIAASDVCVVKLLVGPGNPGPVGAPSTSSGIGIEIWVPAVENWNKRLHATGGGGWAGGTAVTSTTVLQGTSPLQPGPTPAEIATIEGAISSVTDTGHTTPGFTGSFAG
jgi:feruloyl esterase